MSTWDKDKIIKAIQEKYGSNNCKVKRSDFKNNPGYPSATTIDKYFGSFNNALTSAGIEVRTNSGFGIPSISKDGHIYRSQAEAYFVDNYLLDKFKYEIEPKYPEPLKWKYDWMLTDLNIYIELSGGLRPQRLLDKKELNISLGIKCIFIDTSNIYKNNWVFDPIKELNCVIPKTLARLSGETE